MRVLRLRPTQILGTASLLIALIAGTAQAYGSILDHAYYSCRAANSAGIFNVPTPPFYVPAGWSHSSDRDGDGISCEPKR